MPLDHAPEHWEQAAARLERLIRQRLARLVKGATSLFFEMDGEQEEDHALLVTSRMNDKLPSKSLLRQVKYSIQGALTHMHQGPLGVRQGLRELPVRLPWKEPVTFAASLIARGGASARAVLTFAYKRNVLQFVLAKPVALLRTASGMFDVAVEKVGSYRMHVPKGPGAVIHPDPIHRDNPGP